MSSSTIQIPQLPPMSRSSSTQSLPSLRSVLESGPSSHRFGKFHSENDQDMEELDDEGDHDDSETMMQRLRLRTRSLTPGLPVRYASESPSQLRTRPRSHPMTHRRAYSLNQLKAPALLVPTSAMLLPPLRSFKALASAQRSVSPPSNTRPEALSHSVHPPPYKRTPSPRPAPSTPRSEIGDEYRLVVQPASPIPAIRRAKPTLPAYPPKNTVSGSISMNHRTVLVNPIMASHLSKGGVINFVSSNGVRRWKVYLPKVLAA